MGSPPAGSHWFAHADSASMTGPSARPMAVRTQSQLFFRNLTFIGACIALFAVFTGIGEDLRYAITDALIDLQ
ncbi:MAG: hypothetical protein S0880_33050 [Actinomycetota bacterium]|nr:hypothetical protein [Actinomycetota bacterium]